MKRGAQPGWLSFRGAQCWLLERPVEGGKWLVAVSIAGLREALDELQLTAAMPQYLGVEDHSHDRLEVPEDRGANKLRRR